ncbi:MAG: dicarboxylate/amino acid:cation symporter [Pirellulaceae bacterium]|nr:dicarboxylate/amino acid:cation symporter [Pirellulaceae bacterium]
MSRIALHWQILIAMIVGAVGGLAMNFSVGDRVLPTPVKFPAGEVQPYGYSSAVKLSQGTFWSHDRPDRIFMQVILDQSGRRTEQRIFVGALDKADLQKPIGKRLEGLPQWPAANPAVDKTVEIIRPSLGELKKADPAAYALFLRFGRSQARVCGDRLKLAGDLFLRMLKMVSVPLIIFSLSTGVLGLGSADRLGKMFSRTLAYYVCTSLLAILTGLLLVNIIQPGVDHSPDAMAASNEVAAPEQGKKLPTVLFEQLENMIPPNPAKAVTDGQFLGIIAFTLAFSICAVLVGGKAYQTVGEIAQAGFEVMMKMTMAVIKLAPFGVLCLMFYAAATQGLSIFSQLGMYMLTVACALAIHAIVTLPLILKFVAKQNPWQFAKAMSPALLTAFSSASSNATLPLTLTSVERRAGVSNRVSSFVLPLGATVNMDGTALYEVVAVLFIANLTPGVDLSVTQQVIVAFTALLASIGAAGIPHAGLVMMVIILQAVGLPTEAQGLIIAVDRILDMARTCVNVWSDSCGCAVIARFQNDD